MTAAPPQQRTATSCTHCNQVVPIGLFNPDRETQFCCVGCEVAFDILQSHGLGQYHTFGDRRATAVASSGREYQEFDHPAFAELYQRPIDGGLNEIDLYLEGVHCASCVWLVERVPLLLPGVARADLDIRRSLARIRWDDTQLSLSNIAQLLDQLGYRPHPYRGVAHDAMRRLEDRAMLTRIGVAGAIAGNVMLAALALYSGSFSGMEHSYEGLFRWLSLGLTLPALVYPGRVFFTGAFAALRTRSLHMDLPIAIALAAGFTRGAVNTFSGNGPIYFDGVSILIFLLLCGRYLQQRGQRAAADATELLFSMTPNTARLLDEDGTVTEVPSEALVAGNRALVRAGESFPADGVILIGETSINSALLTGESHHVTAGMGDQVYAGTVNISGPVQFRVVASGESTRLAAILAQIEASAQRRAPVVVFANQLSGWFVLATLMLAAVTFLIWLPRDSALAWDHAIALLVVTCPCALALATPLAVTVAIGRAARAGIFIKGGDALERLSRPGEVILDKTGTLTEGQTRLQLWLGPSWVQPFVLGLEAGSSHPVAESFRRAWPHMVAASVETASHMIGAGISGRVAGVDLIVGSPQFVLQRAVGGESLALELTRHLLTPVLVAVNGEVVAAAGIGDQIRTDAPSALAELRTRGWRTTMLSGDDPRVASAVGGSLGFAAEATIGGATPEQKLALVESRVTGGECCDRPTVMVGDGVNDAAAMAMADVGIGVHGGAEACLASADIFLTTPGIEPVVRLMEGASRTMRVIRRNIAFALAYNVVGVALAMTGTISPLLAAVMMPASSLTVVLGSWLGRTFDLPKLGAVSGPPRPGFPA